MKIVVSKQQSRMIPNVLDALNTAIVASRFTANMDVQARTISLKMIRLKELKPYCGNHPNACEIGGKDRRGKYLEGADWVEFNDLLNNVLDSLEISANVSSSVCIIRKETKRRINYSSSRQFNQFQWDREGNPIFDYTCYIGQIAPISTFPEGTPGIYTNRYNVKG